MQHIFDMIDIVEQQAAPYFFEKLSNDHLIRYQQNEGWTVKHGFSWSSYDRKGLIALLSRKSLIHEFESYLAQHCGLLVAYHFGQIRDIRERLGDEFVDSSIEQANQFAKALEDAIYQQVRNKNIKLVE